MQGSRGQQGWATQSPGLGLHLVGSGESVPHVEWAGGGEGVQVRLQEQAEPDTGETEAAVRRGCGAQGRSQESTRCRVRAFGVTLLLFFPVLLSFLKIYMYI